MKGLKLFPQLSPKLLITPQLKQALYILQLPHYSLKEYLEKIITENPVLQPSSEESLDIKIKKILNSHNTNFPDSKSFSNIQSVAFMEKQKPSTISLQDYLLHQLRMTLLNKEELILGERLINHIDTNGYLQLSLEQFSKNNALALNEAEKVLKIIQTFEPFGVGAKNLQECLLIQLKNRKREHSLAYRIVQSCFKELARKKYKLIAKKLNIKISNVKGAFKETSSLNPKPGTAVSKEEQSITIEPDVFVRIHRHKLQIVLNNVELPELKINPVYKKILDNPHACEETKQFIKERIRNALWLIKAMGKRQDNILKVLRVITRTQKQALCNDLSYVKPLTLKDVARKTGLHISTIARIASNKYIATPQGTIRLKNLFSLSLKSEKNKMISTKSIFYKLKDTIFHENKEKPLTDQAIVGILNKEGIKISRRTVTKYRNKLKILPSFLR